MPHLNDDIAASPKPESLRRSVLYEQRAALTFPSGAVVVPLKIRDTSPLPEKSAGVGVKKGREHGPADRDAGGGDGVAGGAMTSAKSGDQGRPETCL